MDIDRKNRKKRPVERAEILENVSWLVTEEEKASRKSRDTDDPVDVILYHPIAIRLTHQFIKAHWSANAVTLLSLVFGVGGAILFYPQNRWINLLGIAIVIFAAILDCCDGQIARLTHTSSQFGRVLDGTVDITGFLAIYVVLGARMMQETIPFTDKQWSFWIWFVIFAAMLAHAGQARIADYYRGLHLFFLNGSNTSNMTRAKNLQEELDTLPADSPFYEKLYRRFYLVYTKNQEKSTPCAQRLLDAIEAQGEGVWEELSDAYVKRSRRYIQLTNLLTYNLRTYALFILLFLGLHVWYFPFVILVLEGVRLFMISRYEGIAKEVYGEFFAGETGADRSEEGEDAKGQ